MANSRLKHRACSWLGSLSNSAGTWKVCCAPPTMKRCQSGAGCGLAAFGQQQYNQTEEPHGPQSLQQGHAVFGDDHLGQVIGDEGDLMSYTNKDEGADHDVKRRVSWDQDQNSLGVCRQPDVILAYEQLGETNRSCSVVCDVMCANSL